MDPRKILVIQLRRVGDLLMLTPALEALRLRFPRAEIHVLAERPGSEVLEGNPHLDRLLVYEPQRPLAWIAQVRSESYDWVIDFLGNPRSALLSLLSGARLRAGPGQVFHRWGYNHRFSQSPAPLYAAEEKLFKLQSLDVKRPQSVLPRVWLEPQRRAWARLELQRLGLDSRRRLGLCPASRRLTRQWPAERFAALARLAHERLGLRPVVFWGPGERSLAESILSQAPEAVLAPETRHLKDLAALLEGMDAVVTNCNGPKHLSVAVGRPTLTLHFSSDPRVWNPPDLPSAPALRAEGLFCIGCRLNRCPYHLECMSLLDPETVLTALRNLIVEAVR